MPPNPEASNKAVGEKPSSVVRSPDIVYANCFQVGHNAFEFLLEFGQMTDVTPEVRVHTRIVCSPPHVANLIDLLQASVTAYEQAFGPVRPTSDSSTEPGDP